MMYPLVRDLAVVSARVRVPVAVACRVLNFSTQGYYAWLKNPVTDRDWSDAHLTNAARQVHAEDPGYGYRFIADELPRLGITASERRVWRLCSQQRLWSTHSKKHGLNGKPGPAVHDNLVKRVFTASKLNELWFTDITEHWTDEGKLYLCAIKDVRSNKIVGYSIDDRMKASLAVTALSYAIAARPNINTVVHSDRGSQFRSRAFVKMLVDNGLKGSMGRVGAGADNAAMESSFALLQKNVLNRHRWSTKQELRLAMMHWIESSYQRKRRQRRLGRLTPVEFEIMDRNVANAA